MAEQLIQTEVKAGSLEAWPLSGNGIVTRPADNFLEKLRNLAPFASRDSVRPELRMVYLERDRDNGACMVATDGRRLCRYNDLRVVLDRSTLVPLTKFLLWRGLGNSASVGSETSATVTRLCVATGPWSYRVKVPDSSYPDWRAVLPDAGKMAHRVVFDPREIAAVLGLLDAPGDFTGVHLTGESNGRLTLTADVKNRARMSPGGRSRYEGSGCNVMVDRNFLADAIKSGFHSFAFRKGGSPLLSENGAGALHLLMPLRYTGKADVSNTKNPCTPYFSQNTVSAGGKYNIEEPPDPKKISPPVSTTTEKKKETMNKEVISTSAKPEVTASPLERLQSAYDAARTNLRETQKAIAGMSSLLRAAVRENRQREELMREQMELRKAELRERRAQRRETRRERRHEANRQRSEKHNALYTEITSLKTERSTITRQMQQLYETARKLETSQQATPSAKADAARLHQQIAKLKKRKGRVNSKLLQLYLADSA